MVWEDEEICLPTVAYSPDGTLFATGGGRSLLHQPYRDIGLVQIWEAAAPKLRFTLEGHSYRVDSVAFSPDGKTLVSGGGKMRGFGSSDSMLKFWDSSNGALVKAVEVNRWWRGYRIVVFGDMAFSPDGKLLAVPMGSGNIGGEWGALRLWNVEKESLEADVPFEAHGRDPVTAALFSPDGDLLVGGYGEGTLKVWNVIAESDVEPPSPPN